MRDARGRVVPGPRLGAGDQQLDQPFQRALGGDVLVIPIVIDGESDVKREQNHISFDPRLDFRLF